MNVKITYLDTAMALIEIGSIRLLTDPVLDDAGTTYDDGVIPLEKTSAASITPQELGRIDAVLLSHDQHSDNLDNRGREFLAQAPRVLTTPEAAQRLGRGAEGLSPWKETHVTGVDGFTIKVTATPAQHGPDGTQELTGTVTGFLIDWAGRTAKGPIYISGDTVPFSGTVEIVKRAAPISIALLHLGHVTPGPDAGMFFSMSAREALEYAEALRAETIIPLHFDGWKHFSESSSNSLKTFDNSTGGERTRWLSRRESIDLVL
jgi:L-ascorbate metabolism protein UlaG (beta-lactamase superfamily)